MIIKDDRAILTKERIFRVPDVPQLCLGCHAEMHAFRVVAELDDRMPAPSTIWCLCGATIHVEPGYRPPLLTDTTPAS